METYQILLFKPRVNTIYLFNYSIQYFGCRALRRVEKGYAANVEEAYNYSHPGSRSTSALEYTLGRLVTVIAREFLQWELSSSLPCKLLLSILSKRLLTVLESISSPLWFLNHLTHLNDPAEQILTEFSTENIVCNFLLDFDNILRKDFEYNLFQGTIPSALSNGIASATAAAIARPLTKPDCIPLPEIKIQDNNVESNSENSPPSLQVPISGRRCLWRDLSASEVDCEIDDDRISPVYEEPTDFASTIARLRNLLQQKSNVTTPLYVSKEN